MLVKRQYMTAEVKSAIDLANAQYYRHFPRVRRVCMRLPRRLAMSVSGRSRATAAIGPRSVLGARDA
jgi:hypothetical protein